MTPTTVSILLYFEGLALGGISFYYNNLYSGIVSQVILLTLGILFSLLFAYKSKIIAPTENFKLGLFAATEVSFYQFICKLYNEFLRSKPTNT